MTIVLDARCASDHFPGIGRYVANLARGLAALDPGRELMLLRDTTAPDAGLSLPQLPVLNCAASPFSISQQWQVPDHLRRAGATLYHSPYYLMPYRPGVPSVFTCHDLIPLVCPVYFSALQRVVYRLGHRLAMAAAAVTVAVSQATQRDLLRLLHADPARIEVIPEAAAPNYVPQPPARIAALRWRLGLPARYVLYVGSNKPHKNLPRLVRAFCAPQVTDVAGDVGLVIAGHWDPRYPQARRLVEAAGLQQRVLFSGPLAEDDLPALYSGATLFVFPSLYEGFGLPVLEAMACGTAVACSNAASLPEVTGHEGALLFDPARVEEIADAIGRGLSEPGLLEALRAAARERAGHFSWDIVARHTSAVYRRVEAA